MMTETDTAPLQAVSYRLTSMNDIITAIALQIDAELVSLGFDGSLASWLRAINLYIERNR